MVDLLALPWWAYLYMILLIGITFGGFAADQNLTIPVVIGHILTLLVSMICILVYCQPDFAKQLGAPLLAAMILYAMAWDFTQSVKDANRIEEEIKREGDLSDDERSALMNSGMLFGALLILPAYMMGVKVWFDLFTAGMAG
jgi:hypothetical protein